MRQSLARRLRHLDFPIGRGDVGASNLGNFLGAAIAHRQFQFPLKDFEDAIDSGLLTSAEKKTAERMLARIAGKKQ